MKKFIISIGFFLNIKQDLLLTVIVNTSIFMGFFLVEIKLTFFHEKNIVYTYRNFVAVPSCFKRLPSDIFV